MQLVTTRFGAVEVEPDDILLFPTGLAGFEECRHWVLLADGDNDTVGWLQSVSQADVAFPVVSPRRYAPHYQVRIGRSQLAPLQLGSEDQPFVLTIVGKGENGLTLNLKAPVIVNIDRRLGRQVVVNDDQSLAYELGTPTAPLRRTA